MCTLQKRTGRLEGWLSGRALAEHVGTLGSLPRTTNTKQKSDQEGEGRASSRVGGYPLDSGPEAGGQLRKASGSGESPEVPSLSTALSFTAAPPSPGATRRFPITCLLLASPQTTGTDETCAVKRASPGFEQRAFEQNHERGESPPFQLFFSCVNLSLLFVPGPCRHLCLFIQRNPDSLKHHTNFCRQ